MDSTEMGFYTLALSLITATIMVFLDL